MKVEAPKPFNVVILYLRNSQIDGHVVELLGRSLGNAACNVFFDRRFNAEKPWETQSLLTWRSNDLVDRRTGAVLAWLTVPESRIRAADAVIVIISESGMKSEMLQYEVEAAVDERRKRGRPFLISVRVGPDKPLSGPLGACLSDVESLSWQGPADDADVVEKVKTAIANSSTVLGPDHHMEAAGGAVSPDSAFYMERPADHEMKNAILARESVILIRGPRQVGKTSLIGQGTKLVTEQGWHQVSTDFQMISSAQLRDGDLFARMLAATIARQLGLRYDFREEWQEAFGPNMNLANFMRDMIAGLDGPLVWFMDEADRLFNASFANDFFGLVRSWHNARATDPRGPWSRFTIVIAYATEARLFIRDLHRSPFNVGRQITMRNFTLEETSELNVRYGSPIKKQSELEALHFLVAGQPFLVRRAFDALATGAIDVATLIGAAEENEGPFSDHLKRLSVAVSRFPNVLVALRSSLSLSEHVDPESVERLIAAGVLRQEPSGQAVPACDLYRRYLLSHAS